MIRFLLAPVLFVSLAAVAAAADDFSTTTPVFAFLPTPNKAEELAKLPEDATENLTLRPNQAGEFYLYAFNPSKVKKTYIVKSPSVIWPAMIERPPTRIMITPMTPTIAVDIAIVAEMPVIVMATLRNSLLTPLVKTISSRFSAV